MVTFALGKSDTETRPRDVPCSPNPPISRNVRGNQPQRLALRRRRRMHRRGSLALSSCRRRIGDEVESDTAFIFGPSRFPEAYRHHPCTSSPWSHKREDTSTCLLVAHCKITARLRPGMASLMITAILTASLKVNILTDGPNFILEAKNKLRTSITIAAS